jgi:type I restriction enzyme S subunit
MQRLKFNLARFEQGWSPQCENRLADPEEWGVLKVGCVNGTSFDPTEHKALPAAEIPNPELEIKSGDVLVSRANTRELLGSAALVKTVRPRLLLCDKLYRLRVRTKRIDPEYLTILLRSHMVRFQIERDATGASSSMQNVSQDTVRELLLPLPPTAEQHRILESLRRETGKIDALIERKERLITLLEEKRAGLINRVVLRGLNLSAPMKDSGIPWLGEIPSNWTVKKLLHLTSAERPVMYGIVLPGPNVEDGVPIVKGGDVAPGRLGLALLNRTSREIESGYARSRLKGGDIVYAIRGSIGSVELVPEELCGANLTQDAARVSPKPSIDGHWLLYALRAQCVFSQVDASAVGATIRGLNIRDLKRVILPVPPIEEQSEIASYLSRINSILDEIAAKTREQITKFHEYRTALISAAVTGKIDLRDSAQA